MGTARLRGHQIYWDGLQWLYADNQTPTEGNPRACGYCGLPDSSEGHDGCLQTIDGVMNACCGHGSPDEAYIQYWDGSCIRGRTALTELTALRQRQEYKT